MRQVSQLSSPPPPQHHHHSMSQPLSTLREWMVKSSRIDRPFGGVINTSSLFAVLVESFSKTLTNKKKRKVSCVLPHCSASHPLVVCHGCLQFFLGARLLQQLCRTAPLPKPIRSGSICQECSLVAPKISKTQKVDTLPVGWVGKCCKAALTSSFNLHMYFSRYL